MDVKKALEVTQKAERVRQLQPTPQDALADLPSAQTKVNEKGESYVSIRGKDDLKRWAQMNAAANRLKIEHGRERVEAMPKERLFNPALGRVEELPVHVAETAAKRRGLTPKINWGRPSYRVTESEIKERLARERDS